MAEPSIEVELRYKVRDPKATIARLAEIGIPKTGQDHIIDQWFAPTSVRSMEQEEEWFDKNHGVAWRIRRTEQPDGTFGVKVDSKQLTDANNHDTFVETPPQVMPYDKALEFMKQKDYRCWLTIDKTRHKFAAGRDQFEIVLDEIEGMLQKIGVAAGLEVEFKGEGTREEALAALGEFAKSLGLDPGDRFERSFTVESMQALANFKD